MYREYSADGHPCEVLFVFLPTIGSPSHYRGETHKSPVPVLAPSTIGHDSDSFKNGLYRTPIRTERRAVPDPVPEHPALERTAAQAPEAVAAEPEPEVRARLPEPVPAAPEEPQGPEPERAAAVAARPEPEPELPPAQETVPAAAEAAASACSPKE
jgi:hypothetical protein